MLCELDESSFNDIYMNSTIRQSFEPFYRSFSELEFYKQQTAIWNKAYVPKFAETFTARGYGFSFNMIEMEKLFHLKE